MKTLLLLRHAKSSPKDSNQQDFERPLNSRGLRAASLMGRFMRKHKIKPDLALSSPAERARRTTAIVMESAKIISEMRYDERIYEASSMRLFEIITQIEDNAAMVLLTGHNPSLEELLERLTGKAQRMRTAALALIVLDIEKWSRARERSGRLDYLVRPKELDRS